MMNPTSVSSSSSSLTSASSRHRSLSPPQSALQTPTENSPQRHLKKLNRKAPSATDPSALYQSDTVYEGDAKAAAANERKKKRSLGIDVREKFPSLFRRPAEQPAQNLNKSFQNREMERLLRLYRPTNEQVERWSSSFDALLSDKAGLALFHEFLRSEFSDENIEFWIACEEYKSVTAPKKMAGRAQKIFNDYVAVQAKREVNLDSTTRVHTETQIQNPNPHCFDQSQKRIQALMEKDSYRRFLRSEAFMALKRELQSQTSSSGKCGVPSTTSSPPDGSSPGAGSGAVPYAVRHKTGSPATSQVTSKMSEMSLISRHESTPLMTVQRQSRRQDQTAIPPRNPKTSVPCSPLVPDISSGVESSLTDRNHHTNHTKSVIFPGSAPNISHSTEPNSPRPKPSSPTSPRPTVTPSTAGGVGL